LYLKEVFNEEIINLSINRALAFANKHNALEEKPLSLLQKIFPQGWNHDIIQKIITGKSSFAEIDYCEDIGSILIEVSEEKGDIQAAFNCAITIGSFSSFFFPINTRVTTQ